MAKSQRTQVNLDKVAEAQVAQTIEAVVSTAPANTSMEVGTRPPKSKIKKAQVYKGGLEIEHTYVKPGSN
jgi:hypothetical protein